MPIIHVRCGSGIWRVDPPPLEISHGKLYDQKYALDPPPPPSRKKKLSLWPLPAKKSVWIRAWNIYMYNRFVTRNDLWETLSSEYIEDSHTQADPAIYKQTVFEKKNPKQGHFEHFPCVLQTCIYLVTIRVLQHLSTLHYACQFLFTRSLLSVLVLVREIFIVSTSK